MSGYRSDIVTRFALWASTIWFLTRYLGIQSQSSLLLSGEIVVSWILLNSINWLYDHVFDVFDEPLAFNIKDWINDRAYPDGLLHFFGLFGSSYIIPTSPEALTEVLSTRAYDYEKTTAFKKFTIRFWGHGIVSQEQEEHKRNRKTYLPVFNQGNVNKLKGMLFKKSTQFVDHVLELCATENDKNITPANSALIPISKTAAMVSLDVTSIISLGVDFETIVGKNHEIFEAYEMLFSGTADKRFLFLLYNIAPQWFLDVWPFPLVKKMDKAHDVLVDVCRQIIRERISEPGKREAQALDFVGNLGKSVSEDEDNIIAQIIVILGAGYESTGGTLAWVIYCVARYQEAQEELRKELAKVCDGKGSLQASSDFDKLPVLNGVIMEAVRLYPTFNLLLRKAIRDTTIAQQLIPKGTYVGLCTRAINSAHHIWGPDAATFNPERWIDRSDSANPKIDPLGGASASVCMLSYFYGTRSCVGRDLAQAQMKRQIALIVERFHIELLDDSDARPSGLFATTPPSDIQVRFTKFTL
ncbi:uncharacterized protein N7500_003745 [Penicillium coprophilum]|uniref:uncharacterized protein n=1 Tax=Penicillium coprophilum TaxID=36646 RepID=UPI002390D7E4|nr:uncharacterized protein N7500_003745 [Penicillium coprophilum]KAJ5170962.1 hypothetical protein N7500_003745 [Penicillium coprophilum]